MKHLNTAPTNTGFFEVYAKLAKSIRKSGVFSQVVSALTEIGGIYAAAYSALLPIFPTFAMYVAGAVAIIGTAVIEFGLRVLTPHTVDAILYKRFAGLHLPMTIAIWLLTAVLIATSGLLSFRNSKLIVNEFTPEAEQVTTAKADSIHQQKTQTLAATWRADSALIAGQYAERIAATEQAAKGKQKAAKRELSNWYNKERRTGNSYATQKDRARQKLADLEAEGAAQIAAIKTAQAKELSEARQRHWEAVKLAKSDHRAATGEIKATNQQAEAERAATVSGYGTGLGWFTVICLFVFTASIILDRIHRKGSGIEEKVELSQYDLNPGAITEALAAFRERWQYLVRNQITKFADRTPPAPLPTASNDLYDPTQAATININLKIEREVEEEEQIIYLKPKRRTIGFNTNGNTKTRHQSTKQKNGKSPGKSTPAQTLNSCAVKEQDNMSLSDLTQRLKMYKKRLGKHQQKASVQQRSKGTVSKRTANAIENNRQWVEYYTQLIDQYNGQE